MTSPIVHDYDSAEHAAAMGLISVEELGLYAQPTLGAAGWALVVILSVASAFFIAWGIYAVWPSLAAAIY